MKQLTIFLFLLLAISANCQTNQSKYTYEEIAVKPMEVNLVCVVTDTQQVFYEYDMITIIRLDEMYIMHSEISERPIGLFEEHEVNALLYWIELYPIEGEDLKYPDYYYSELVKEKIWE